MNIERTWQTESTSLDATLAVAAAIGRRLRGGEVIALASDLGGGKTAFVRGLADGMGSTDLVHSPSFTLNNQYQSGELTLYHFDFHRLNEPGIMRDELAEILTDEQAVIAIEWADIIADVLPPAHLTLTIRPTGQASRQLEFSYPEQLQYLFEDNA